MDGLNKLLSMFILSVSQIPVTQNDNFTVSILHDNSYTLVEMKGGCRFVIEAPGCCTVNFASSFEKSYLNAPKNPLPVGCRACDV